MSRAIAILSVIVVAMFGTSTWNDATYAMAQTAPWSSAGSEEGVTFELVALGPAFDLSIPVSVSVARVTVEPGSAFPITSAEPTAGILLVESGTFTVRIDAEISVSRGANMGETRNPATEAVAAGTEIKLGPGDAAYIPARVDGEVRNGGLTPAVGLAILASSQEAM